MQTKTDSSLINLFNSQKAKAKEIKNSSRKDRIKKIKLIKNWLLKHENLVADALYSDFKKSPVEVKISEILPIIGEINHTIKNLGDWMAPQYPSTPLKLIGTSSKIVAEPKGCSLIISPWNYPINLALKPLVQAIAAGCTVILKPSELTPASSQLLKIMLSELFDESEVAVRLGDAEVAIELQKLPFNHVFFTGSPTVGKLVMKAAANHLASVTLELGGKSPTIINKDANLEDAAKKIGFAKFLNNAQTCIAPDYILVHEDVKQDFVTAFSKTFQNFGNDNIKNSQDYCRIVNDGHFNRLSSILEDAKQNGAEVLHGGNTDQKSRFIEPTIVGNISEEMRIMQEEIFGPIIPIKTFSDITEVANYINENEKPLALYYFGKSNKDFNFIVENTSSGAILKNDTTIHYLHDGLPFGGINNSGIGKSFGYFGFLEFSNLKPIMKNNFYFADFLYPPYKASSSKILDFLIKYLA